MNSKSLNDLKEMTPLTYGLERIFWFVQYAFLGTYYLKTRVWVDEQVMHGKDLRELTRSRVHKVELYLLLWATTLVILAIVLPTSKPGWNHLLAIIPTYRILELLQSAINMNIFDRLRIVQKTHYVASKERTLVISVWNYIEI